MGERISGRGKNAAAFMVGMLLGTWFGNGSALDLVYEIGIFSSEYFTWLQQRNPEDLRNIFLFLMLFRGLPLVFILVIPRGKAILFRVLLFLYGFSVSVVGSVTLLLLGLRGALVFLTMLFPHGVFYVILLYQIEKELYVGIRGKWMIQRWLFLLSLLIFAAASEACLHPQIMKWVLNTIPMSGS
ncbi:MAG: hypothetical protein PUB22_00860 [Clostridiales bacterium]|nr:hypothetical protein [Clostridiales bacterium]